MEESGHGIKLMEKAMKEEGLELCVIEPICKMYKKNIHMPKFLYIYKKCIFILFEVF